MDWQNDRLSKRLALSPERTEEIYALLAEIDAVRQAFQLTDRLLPHALDRLTESVIVVHT